MPGPVSATLRQPRLGGRYNLHVHNPSSRGVVQGIFHETGTQDAQSLSISHEPDGVVLDQPQINRVFDGQGSMVGDDCMDDGIERHRVQGLVGGHGLHAGEREQLLHEVRGAFDTALWVAMASPRSASSPAWVTRCACKCTAASGVRRA